MRRILIFALLWALPALGQAPPTGNPNIVKLAPKEVETVECEFASWTLTGAGIVTVTVSGLPTKPDGAPQNIITAGPTLSGSVVSVQITPDTGCGTSGCRAGNSYQIDLQPQEATAGNPNKPICSFRVDVAKTVFAK